MKNKIMSLSLIMLLILSLAACGKNDKDTSKPADGGSSQQASTESYGIHHAVITVKNYGEIKLELDGDTAPITVKNFVDLAKSGFYDGLTFHRSVPGFVIQGGDPNADGTGGSDTSIKGEFSENGVKNSISHKRGVISMARLGNDNNSATSQFFIVLDDAAIPSLDGMYAAFGYVTEGMDVIDKIVSETPVSDSYTGLVAKENQPVIEKIEITD